jgi:hypothetical protein
MEMGLTRTNNNIIFQTIKKEFKTKLKLIKNILLLVELYKLLYSPPEVIKGKIMNS